MTKKCQAIVFWKIPHKLWLQLSLLLLLITIPYCEVNDDLSPIGESPTGTFLSPQGGEELGDPQGGEELGQQHGYEALDEACELTDAPDYLDRFVTPMFRSVAHQNGIAFLVDGSHLWVIDITQPTDPLRLSLTRLRGHPLALAITDDGYLVVASGGAGLLVLDVSEPRYPQEIGSLELPDIALDVAMLDSMALVAVGNSGLTGVDLTNPEQPGLIHEIAVPGFTNGVDIEGDRAYTASCATVSVVNIMTAQPMVSHSFWIPGGHAKDVDADGDSLYVAAGELMLAYDISNSDESRWIGYYADPETKGFYVNAVVAKEGIVYIAAGDESVRSVDAAALDQNGGEPVLIVNSDEPPPNLIGPDEISSGNLRTEEVRAEEVRMVQREPGDPIGIGIADNLLLVLGNFRWVAERLLRIMDISTPGQMTDVGSYVQPDNWIGMDFFNSSLIVHGNDSTSTTLTLDGQAISSFELPGKVKRTISRGDELFMLLEEGEVLRLKDEIQVLFDSEYDLWAYDLTIWGNFGYISDLLSNGVVPFEIIHSEPGDTVIFLQFPPNQSIEGMLGFSHLLAGANHLYAYDWVMGMLVVFDLRTPESPRPVMIQKIGQCEKYDILDFYSGRRDIRTKLLIDSDSLHILCPYNEQGISSLLSFSLTNPAFPELYRTLDLPDGRYMDFVVESDHIFATGFDNNSYYSTVTRIDSDEIWTTGFDGHATQILLNDDYLLVLNSDRGIHTFNISGGEQPYPAGLITVP